MHMYIHRSSTASRSQWWCSGVEEGGWGGAQMGPCTAHICFSYYVIKSFHFWGFCLKKTSHPHTLLMRPETRGGFGAVVFILLDLLLKGRSAECGVTRDPNTGITILGQSVVKEAGFNIKIKEPKTSQLTVSFEKEQTFGVASTAKHREL